MKKIIATLLVAMMCIALFAGCGSDTAKDTTSGNGGTSSVGFATDDVQFIDANGESVYTIVRPEGDAEAQASGAVLFKKMKMALGISVKNVDDSSDGTDKYEILVGETNRPESAYAKQYIIESVGARYDDYIICTIGKKIVIYALNPQTLNKACEYFAENFTKKEGISGGIKYVCAAEGNYVDTNINGVKLGCFRYVRPRYNQPYIVENQFAESNEMLYSKTGYRLNVVEDHNAETECEIIVGDTSRAGVEKVLNTDEYTIKISGKKVYLNGGSPAAKAMAVSEFVKMLCAGAVTDANSLTASYSQTVSGYDTSNYYKPTWTDDFDAPSSGHATGVDLSKWAWGVDSATGMNGRTSVRSQDPSHLFVSEGMLNFFAAYDDKNYYGFKLTTNKKMTYKYGILEMSAILPDSNGPGFWISLWANSLNEVTDESPSAFFTEVNVVEMFGTSGWEASNLHGWLKSGMEDVYDEVWAPLGLDKHWSLDGKYSNYKKYQCPDSKFNDGLHTFTFIWSEEDCSFACDGNVYFTLDPNEEQHYTQTFNQPIHLILSQATCFAQQTGTGPADDSPVWTESNNFQIDYVHIYQKDDGKHTMTLY